MRTKLIALIFVVGAMFAQSNEGRSDGQVILQNYFDDFIQDNSFGTSVLSRSDGQTTYQNLFIDFLLWADTASVHLTPDSLSTTFLVVSDTAFIDTLENNVMFGGTATFIDSIGIGLTSLSSQLHIESDGVGPRIVLTGKTDATADAILLLSATGATNVQGLQLRYDRGTAEGYIENLYNNDAGNIVFRTKTAGTPINAMTILGTGAITFPAGYSRHIELQVGSAVLGPTAPSPTTVGTFRGLGFDADNEVANFIFDVPTDWDGVSDMTAHVHWYPTSGDAVANGETVQWDITYRSIAEGEAVDSGSSVTASGTLTGGASETDKELYYTEIILDYDHADQPLTAEDCVGIQFDRDVTTDTYSGAGIVTMLHIQYNSITLPEG